MDYQTRINAYPSIGEREPTFIAPRQRPTWLIHNDTFYACDGELIDEFTEQGIFGEYHCKLMFAWERWEEYPFHPCIYCGKVVLHYELDSPHVDVKCPECKRHYNIKTGTALGDSKLAYCYWWRLAYLLSHHQKALSSHYIAFDLGVTQKTAYFLLKAVATALGETTFSSPFTTQASLFEIIQALTQPLSKKQIIQTHHDENKNHGMAGAFSPAISD